MHNSGSVILTCLERFRAILDESELDAKYTNDWIVRHLLAPSYVDVAGRLAQDTGTRTIIRHSLSLVVDTEHYLLPPNIGQILRLAKTNSDGSVSWEIIPNSEYHPYGPQWAIEGQYLAIRPTPGAAETVDIWYTPALGEAPLCYGVCNLTDATTINAPTPTYGHFDRRPYAYVGANLRLIPAAGQGHHEDLIIESQTLAVSPVLTPRTAILYPYTYPAADIPCEIAPPGMQALVEPISLLAAIRHGAARAIRADKMKYLRDQYAVGMKTLRDRCSNMQGRTGHSWEKAVLDRTHHHYSALGWF